MVSFELLKAAAVAAVLAIIAAVTDGCFKKVAAPTAEATDIAAADILFEFADSTGAAYLAFIDSRDGQKYRAVKIGKDIWMAQNLNYVPEKSREPIYDHVAENPRNPNYEYENSWCLEDDVSGCVKFGRLYNWDAAQIACPAGWHLSTAGEWDSLMMAAGGKRGADDESEDEWDHWTLANKKLKAKTGWKTGKGENGNGMDDYGFSALAGGQRYSSGKYSKSGEQGVWWTSMENNGSSAYRMEMQNNFSYIGTNFKEQGFSVRCVSDDGVVIKAGAGGAFSLTLDVGIGGAASAKPRKESYAAGEKVTLTAVPDAGYVFAGWTGGRASDSSFLWHNEKKIFIGLTDGDASVKDSTALVTTVTVHSNMTVTANFRRIDYGALTDARDGKTYRTVKIGRKTWMAENLNYKTEDGGSSCRGKRIVSCEKYGRLYDWNTAQEACPVGWQLPSFEDYEALVVYAGGPDVAGRTLKAASGWVGDAGYRGKGTDDYGFSALPGGGAPYRFENNNIFGSWWTTTKMYGGAVCARITLHQDKFGGLATDKSDRYSVRCVMDEGGSLTLTAGAGGTVSSVPRKTSFKAGETATITATPRRGYIFAYWTGDNVADPTAPVTTVAVRSNLEITAHFRAAPNAPGTLHDKRDGQKYRTAKIGGQTWMAQNLNYKTDNSWCYNDSDSYCKKYGRLYDWNAAKKACPVGWHLPQRTEWDILVKAVGGEKISDDEDDDTVWVGADKALKSKTGWGTGRVKAGSGTDDYGFAALPGGGRQPKSGDDDLDDAYFYDTDNNGYWWTATDADDSAYIWGINNYTDELMGFYINKDYGLAVRCVMDDGNKQASAQKAKRAVGKGGKPEIEMVFVKGGTFKMGCDDAKWKQCHPVESMHNVTLGDFYIGKYEITQKQWTAVMDGNPSFGPIGDDYPVNNISWDDMEEFIERLNAATGKKYRLPTEAQWEYAARGGAGGKGYKYSGGDNPDDVAWHRENSGGEAHPVGTKAPNELGIYDMTGNVWEVLSDYMEDYDSGDKTDPTGPIAGDNHAARGCSWGERPCRVYDRGYSPIGESSYDAGFRLVLSP